MIDGLIMGKLYGKPTQRTGNSGKPFVVTKVRTAAGDGEGLFVSVIAFSAGVRDGLLALDDGDSVALSGMLTPKVWQHSSGEARPSLDMVAHGLLTPYHVTRKRQAVAQVDAPAGKRDKPHRAPSGDGLDDDLPWEE